ncbi:Crp/Fnr family transcriptional regulator [Methylotetracoccus oryzae]|uniref:Crp/Fnr family transcriptional regulator n=1 Tax=Methylotetracoccus oryzae TaxID=1919059 RepID=UPI0013A5BBFD|nr:Crp/Fnr family transcriptional regulator [Methylotetracoccus oryzae]
MDPSAASRCRPVLRNPTATVKYREVVAGESVFRSTDNPQAIVIIRSGLVKVIDYSEGGTERIMLLAGRGSAVGLEAVLGQPMRYGAVAIRSAQICRIPVAVLATLGSTDAGVYRQLMSLWQANLEFADRSLSRYSSGPIALRILRLIADQIATETSSDHLEINLLRRQDMAAVMGVAPENISRAIAEFRRKKLLRKVKRDVYRCDLKQIRHLVKTLAIQADRGAGKARIAKAELRAASRLS